MLHLAAIERICENENKGAKERIVGVNERSYGEGTQIKREHGCLHNTLENDIVNEHPSLYNLWLIDRN